MSNRLDAGFNLFRRVDDVDSDAHWNGRGTCAIFARRNTRRTNAVDLINCWPISAHCRCRIVYTIQSTAKNTRYETFATYLRDTIMSCGAFVSRTSSAVVAGRAVNTVFERFETIWIVDTHYTSRFAKNENRFWEINDVLSVHKPGELSARKNFVL